MNQITVSPYTIRMDPSPLPFLFIASIIIEVIGLAQGSYAWVIGISTGVIFLVCGGLTIAGGGKLGTGEDSREYINKYNYNEVIHSIANYLLMDIKEIIIVHHHIYSTVDMWIWM